MSEGAHFACTFALQRIALRTKAWFAVITAQLAGNAISLIVPGGAAAGAAVQFRMLGTAGMDATESVSGLTAFSFLGIGGLLALPGLRPAGRGFGAPVASGLIRRRLGRSDRVRPVRGVRGDRHGHGRPAAVGRPGGPGGAQPGPEEAEAHRGPAGAAAHQRNVIRTVLGQQWWEAALLSVGRLLFDYLCLLFCVRAVGADPRPSLILLAYAVAGVIGLLPITPGGIGVVEASLAGFLALAGLDGAQAVLATLAYRLASYWLPMMAGPIAYAAFRHRYRNDGRPTPELGATSASRRAPTVDRRPRARCPTAGRPRRRAAGCRAGRTPPR